MAKDIGRSVGRMVRAEGKKWETNWDKPKMEAHEDTDASEPTNSQAPGGKLKRKMRRIGHELKEHPPAILAKTMAKKGKAAAEKQRVAILMSKAGAAKKKG